MSTWLITGANRGIGLEFVRQLAARNQRVIAVCRNPQAAAEARTIAARTLAADVSNEASLAALAAELGGEPIDVLINNAGVSSETRTLADCTAERLASVLTVNAIGPILTTRALLPRLRDSKRRLIVHISSQLGSIANNTGGSSYGYRASKAAINQLNRSLAAELAPDGFTCLAMHPGWVRTDMGGPNATLSPQQSVASMLGVLDAATPAQNGAFLNFDGTVLPW